MKIYKTNDPHFSLIVAKTHSDLLEIYNARIAEVTGENEPSLLIENTTIIGKEAAIRILASTKTDDNYAFIGRWQATQLIESALIDPEPSILSFNETPTKKRKLQNFYHWVSEVLWAFAL